MDELNTIISLVGSGGTTVIAVFIWIIKSRLDHVDSRFGHVDKRLCEVVNSMNVKLDAIQDSVNRKLYYEDGGLIYVMCKDCDKKMDKFADDINQIGNKARRAEAVANEAIDKVRNFQIENNL